jgi:hypothetical protein
VEGIQELKNKRKTMERNEDKMIIRRQKMYKNGKELKKSFFLCHLHLYIVHSIIQQYIDSVWKQYLSCVVSDSNHLSPGLPSNYVSRRPQNSKLFVNPLVSLPFTVV